MSSTSQRLLSWCFCIVVSTDLIFASQEKTFPTIRVIEYDQNSQKLHPIDSDKLIKTVNVSSNSDLVVGKDTGQDVGLILECRAEYPIQWIYRGDGIPEFATNTSVKYDPMEFIATVSLGFTQKLNKQDTGNYTCKSIRRTDVCVFLYLFVPGDSLFTTSGGDNITFSKGDSSVRIPCSLSQPNAVVTLQKSVNGKLQCPLNDSVSFDPKKGYQLTVNDINDVEGMYICTAGFSRTFQIIEYSLIAVEEEKQKPENSNSTEFASLCHHSPCGLNSVCREVNAVAACRCAPGYYGNPYVKCNKKENQDFSDRPQSCKMNSECQQNASCIENKCISPCKVVCGRNTDCKVVNHTPRCTCQNNYIGDPYNECIPELVTSTTPSTTTSTTTTSTTTTLTSHTTSSPDSPNKPQPNDPCDKNNNPCGSHSECKFDGIRIICSCKRGNIGTPPNCRPECEQDAHCSHNRACTGENKCEDPCRIGVCARGASCRTINHYPVCECQYGQTGDPYVNCYAMENDRRPDQPNSLVDSPCKPSGSTAACGPNTECRVVNNQAACRCAKGGYRGNPFKGCRLDGCEKHLHCSPKLACDVENGICVDPCLKNYPCGTKKCRVQNHIPVCRSDPESVEIQDPQNSQESSNSNPCLSSHCGPNTVCTSVKGVASCKCMPNAEGNPYIGCRRLSCTDDAVCRSDQKCIDNVCQKLSSVIVTVQDENQTDACQPNPCGANAVCRIINKMAICKCRNSYQGDPYTECTLKCTIHSDCPPELMCSERNQTCVANATATTIFDNKPNKLGSCNPSPCGVNTKCSTINGMSMCQCLNSYIGDPYAGCRAAIQGTHTSSESSQEIKEDTTATSNYTPCHPLPCGKNAYCNEETDPKSCSCLREFYGDPYTGCERGIECSSNEACPRNESCVNKRCLNPCKATGICGINQMCKIKDHTAKCVCKVGYKRKTSGQCMRLRNTSMKIEQHPQKVQEYNNSSSDCDDSVCGPNSRCRIIEDSNAAAVCFCEFNMLGSPPNCRPECTAEEQCNFDKTCRQGQCVDPCVGACGFMAKCVVVRRVALCQCPEGLDGDPYTACRKPRSAEII